MINGTAEKEHHVREAVGGWEGVRVGGEDEPGVQKEGVGGGGGLIWKSELVQEA